MGAAAKVWSGSAAVLLGGLLTIWFYTSRIDYVPDRALVAASRAAGPVQARAAIAHLLRDCMRGDAIEQALAAPVTFWSLENDVGLFASTQVACGPRGCVVRATALVPHRSIPDVCAIRHRHGRRSYGRANGAYDWFPTDVDPKRHAL